MASGSLEAAWQVFWQRTQDIHNFAAGGLQADRRPGYAQVQKELQPQRKGQIVERTGGLLARRIGRLETLARVSAMAGAESARIKRQQMSRAPIATAGRCWPWWPTSRAPWLSPTC